MNGSGEVDRVEERGEGGDLVALVRGLPLGKDVAVLVHRGDQRDGRPVEGAGAADSSAVDGDHPPVCRLGAGVEEDADGLVEGVTVEAAQQPSDRARVRGGDPAGEEVGREAERPQDPRRRVRDPFPDGCQGSLAPVRTAAETADSRAASG